MTTLWRARGDYALESASPLEGGVPIIVNGQIVGAVGASGGTSQQNAPVAQTGVDWLK